MRKYEQLETPSRACAEATLSCPHTAALRRADSCFHNDNKPKSKQADVISRRNRTNLILSDVSEYNALADDSRSPTRPYLLPSRAKSYTHPRLPECAEMTAACTTGSNAQRYNKRNIDDLTSSYPSIHIDSHPLRKMSLDGTEQIHRLVIKYRGTIRHLSESATHKDQSYDPLQRADALEPDDTR
nr:hypothetical protein Iba_chr06bCG15970 [Ipomoea batatas]